MTLFGRIGTKHNHNLVWAMASCSVSASSAGKNDAAIFRLLSEASNEGSNAVGDANAGGGLEPLR